MPLFFHSQNITAFGNSFFSRSPSSLSAPYDGDSYFVSVTSDYDFIHITTSQAWIGTSVSSGSGNFGVMVTVSANPNTSTRSGTIYFRHGVGGTLLGSIVVLQAAAVSGFSISRSYMKFDYSGNSIILNGDLVTLTAVSSWSCTRFWNTGLTNWAHLVVASTGTAIYSGSAGTYYLRVSCGSWGNPSLFEARNATFSFTSGGETNNLNVVQGSEQIDPI